MQEYEFERIPVARTRAGLRYDVDYQEVIRVRAKAGWLFVQAITFESVPHPYLDLVFTRKVAK